MSDVMERPALAFSAEVLRLDAAAATDRVAAAIREHALRRLRKRGVVLGLSGGVDSSVTAALCARALGREKVSPKEVENALYALPGIREAAVVGVPDPVLGLALKAVVAADPQAKLTAHDVIRHCARHLEDFMVPKMVEFRDALPKTESGKISRRLVAVDTLEPAA